MSYTEQEARQKWCPFARVAYAMKDVGIEGVVSGNRTFMHNAEPLSGYDFNNPPQARCIASDCMAWRFVTEYEEHANTGGRAEMIAEGWEAPFKDVTVYRRKKQVGFCGLAGKP